MNPTLKSIFNFFENTECGKHEIDKIELSKQHKAMRLVLSEKISEAEAEFIAKTISEKMNLKLVEVSVKEKNTKNSEAEKFHTISAEKTVEKPIVKKVIRDLGKAETSGIIIGKEINSTLIPISAINEGQKTVCFSGTVFETDIRNIKRKKDGKGIWIVTLDITDFEDSITIKMFIDEKDQEKYDSIQKAFGKVNKNVEKLGLKAGVRVVVSGTPKFDDFAGELVVNAKDISYAEAETPKMDNAEKKRVELHLHTQMSQMDAVSSAASLIERAISWGHTAIAITDHGVAQSYPDALHASDDNKKIKIIFVT